jgi:hypothetical protein
VPLVGGDGGGEGIWSEILWGCFYKMDRGLVIRAGGSIKTTNNKRCRFVLAKLRSDNGGDQSA